MSLLRQLRNYLNKEHLRPASRRQKYLRAKQAGWGYEEVESADCCVVCIDDHRPLATIPMLDALCGDCPYRIIGQRETLVAIWLTVPE